MNEQHPISGIMGITMDKLKEMVDVNTIIGDPIKIDEKTTVIPISKVSFGFASGGSDLPAKQPKDLFGGGSGARRFNTASRISDNFRRKRQAASDVCKRFYS